MAQGLISNRTLSYVLAPYYSDLTVFTNNTVPAQIDRMSYLTLNGIDETDYVGKISWFNRTDTTDWNNGLVQLRI